MTDKPAETVTDAMVEAAKYAFCISAQADPTGKYPGKKHLRKALEAALALSPPQGQSGERKSLYDQAYENVVAIRGSNDVPGFDACVRAEMNAMHDRLTAENARLNDTIRLHASQMDEVLGHLLSTQAQLSTSQEQVRKMRATLESYAISQIYGDRARKCLAGLCAASATEGE